MICWSKVLQRRVSPVRHLSHSVDVGGATGVAAARSAALLRNLFVEHEMALMSLLLLE